MINEIKPVINNNGMMTFGNIDFGKINVLIDKKSNIWFKAKDVCDAVEIKNARKAVKRIDADEVKTIVTSSDAGFSYKSKTNFISEPGLYHLLNGSRKKQAKPFQRWVNHEVLPSIRKYGFYFKNREAVKRWEQMSENEREIAYLKEHNQKIEYHQRLKNANDYFRGHKDIIDFLNRIKDKDTDISMKDFADALSSAFNVDFGRTRLYEWLRQIGLICKNSTRPTHKAIKVGFFKVELRTDSKFVKFTTRLTIKGAGKLDKLFEKEKLPQLKQQNQIEEKSS
jgi:prophage antirepressor-like protein